MKKSLLMISLALAGCSILGPTYSGESMASGLLKSDVETLVNRYFFYANQCRAQKIHTEIGKVKMRADNKIVDSVSEIWTVSGCGKTESYNVYMRTDSNNETDITVGKAQ